MYLSKLKVHGFKSFALPTYLRFDPGITAIVGPNGCGKSNVVDAIRWVIGEQRARILRSEKMENVIFTGTSKRRPLGMAEVELTVENTRGALPIEYAEVTLGRRLYRSGESEYQLNGTPCRLRDIVDLFMDTGMGAGAYSVIELKMIEEILSDSAQDRRRLFEEAAGITKYKQRRGQTLRKLAGTKGDLRRVRDLTAEIEKRVRSLKRQAAAASRHNEIKSRAEELESALARLRYIRYVEEERSFAARRQELGDLIADQTARIATEEAEREVLRKRLVDRQAALSESERRLHVHLGAVKDLEHDLRLDRQRLRTATAERDRTSIDLEESKVRTRALVLECEELVSAVEWARPACEESGRLFSEARHRRDLARENLEARHRAVSALRGSERACSAGREENLRRLERITAGLRRLGAEEERMRAADGSFEEFERQAALDTERVEKRREAAAHALGEARGRLETRLAEHRRLEGRIARATSELHDLQQGIAAREAERGLLTGILRTYGDFPDAVRFLTASGSLPLVSDVLTCPERYRAALDAALDGLGACLVARHEREAMEAVARLRAEDRGRARFVIMERVGGIKGSAPAPDRCVPLVDVASVRAPEYLPLARLLLGDVFVVDTLDDAVARRGSQRAARFVTLAGEWADGLGFVHAGSGSVKPSPGAERMARRDRLDRTLGDLESLGGMKAAARESLDALACELAAVPIQDAQKAVQQSESVLREIDLERARSDEALSAVAHRRREAIGRLGELARERVALAASEAELHDAVRRADEAMTRLRAEIADAERLRHEAERAVHVAQDACAGAAVAAQEARTRFEIAERDRKRVKRDAEGEEARIRTREARMRTLGDTIQASKEAAAGLENELAAEHSRRRTRDESIAEDRQNVQRTLVDIHYVEERIRTVRREREDSLERDRACAIGETETRTRLDDLVRRVRERPEIEPGAVELADDFDEEAAREESESMRRKLKAMGSVNALALEEFEAESGRLAELSAQCTDLERAEVTLHATIEEINATARKRFSATYAAIRDSFRTLFKELFGREAHADLVYDASSDPLEAPIDIVATPRGKRPIHIAQLSSGEKTLTAIALLFAIYLVKPSPFCFLDEVDAPLDDANIDRFMRLIRRFSLDTQFILVTHNKRTMEMADRLYGITMQERGVSRMVGVQFEEAMAFARQD